MFRKENNNMSNENEWENVASNEFEADSDEMESLGTDADTEAADTGLEIQRVRRQEKKRGFFFRKKKEDAGLYDEEFEPEYEEEEADRENYQDMDENTFVQDEEEEAEPPKKRGLFGFFRKKKEEEEPEEQYSEEEYEPEEQDSEEGYEPEEQDSEEGYEPEEQDSEEGYEPEEQDSEEEYEPEEQDSEEGYEPDFEEEQIENHGEYDEAEYDGEEYSEEACEEDGEEYIENAGYDESDGEEEYAEDSYEPEGVLSEEGYYEFEEEKKKIPKKKLLIAAGAVVIVIGAVVFFMVKNIKGGDAGEAYVQSVKEIMGYGSASGANNRYTGEVEPQDSWNISLQSDLSVEKCFVAVGDEVKKGDKLFSYNTEELKLAKDKKELEVETLKNENTQLNKDIATYQSDLKSASASEKIELQTQILTAQTTIKKNEFSIKSGNDDIKKLKANIKDATVTSKMDGVVKTINASLGNSGGDDMDTGASDTGDGSTYMSILAIGDYRVKGKVTETNVWDLNEGDPVIVRSRVDDSATWSGTISKINTDNMSGSDNTSGEEDDYMDDGMSKESASSYSFYVSLESDDGLMMGQHVLIEQDRGQGEQKEGIWIPSAYLKIDGEEYYVWTAGMTERLKLQKVTVGEYDEDLDEYEIIKGLALDDYIACDADNLVEGMKTTKEEPAMEDDEEYLDEEANDDEVYDEGSDEYYEDFDESSDEYYEEPDEFDDNQEMMEEGIDESEYETIDEEDNGDTDVIDFTSS